MSCSIPSSAAARSGRGAIAAALAVLLAAAGGCAEYGRYAEAVWSDTDESWLVVRGKERFDCDAWECSDHGVAVNHALWIHPVDGDEPPRKLLGSRSGQALTTYWMQSAGYALVHHDRTWERIGVGGDVQDVESGSHRLQFLPSPDGSILGRIRQSEDCTIDACLHHVSFVDADSLEPVGGSAEHELLDNTRGTSRTAWGPDGQWLYVASETEAFRVHVDGRMETDAQRPDCGIGTTSSIGSADARIVRADVVNGDLELRVSDSGGVPWPEVCFLDE